MPRMPGVDVEGGAISEEDDQPGVVGPRCANDVLPHLQVENIFDVGERAEARTVFRACGRVDLGFVLEADDVHDHQSSSPSISSSPTSTTTLWTSTRNHWRNVFKSRVGGHVDSSSVHAAS